jgi:biopolymer transport protein ExbD
MIEREDASTIPAFVVQCHDAIRLQELVDVLDACRAAGFTEIQLVES